MAIDLVLLQPDKGGDPDKVRDSQKRRFAPDDLVDRVIQMHKDFVKLRYDTDRLNQDRNAVQKEIGAKMKAKENADDLKQKKVEIEEKIAALKVQTATAEEALNKQAGKIGNLVHASVPVSNTEDDNRVERTWHPDGPNGKPEHRTDILPHHEVMYRLEILDQERGSKVAGHRGFFLLNDGVDLNQALISYGLDFLRKRQYSKIQPPFMMLKELMGKTAQLEEFDESLYKIAAEGDNDKYLIATSEQPISAYYSNEWFDKPSEQLPKRFAGYSTCFRKEAGAHGRDTWGIFRVHQFEKIEQFCVTEPANSWAMFDDMVANSEAFLQSLGLPYQVVSIVSGALNNAAAKKYDLEAWFPFQGEHKELVSVSNCTDYQSRDLEVRCGVKKQGDLTKNYVHMLNGTLCATERALCCIVENYQKPDGLEIPEVLRPYMQGRDFLPYTREAPKQKAAATKAAGKTAKEVVAGGK